MTQTIDRARERALPTLVLAGLLAAGLGVVAAIGSPGGLVTAAQAQYAPQNTSPPTITGRPQVGQPLTATTGTWAGAPTAFAFQWLRCNPAGAQCVPITGATGGTYVVQPADMGNSVRVQVTATSATGSTAAESAPTAVPAEQVVQPDGIASIPVTSVRPPERLLVERVQFVPNPVRSRTQPVEIRVNVRDTRGFHVRGAHVFVRSTPLLTTTPPESATGADGRLILSVMPFARFPLQTGHNVQFFVRARNPADPLLTGVSIRRLVQVRTANPN